MTRGRARAARLAFLVAAVLPLALPCGLRAAEPRSAIPWLSQSIEIDGTPPPPSRARSGRTAPGEDVITVTPLGDIRRDAVGLLTPERSGFARALWGNGTTPEVRALVLDHPDQGVPEAQALFHRLLVAEADPPGGDAGTGDSVLVARVDRLLEMGALDEALALIQRAGPESPDLFRRWFDTSLLLDQPAEPCAALRQNPSLSPTLPARVFCLARGGDWNAAEITLTLGQQVGSIPAAEEALLARFLDPEIFEEEEGPPVPDPLTPLDFLMREAVGLPRPSGALPLAFLHPDLDPHAPMRNHVEAAERLAVSGALGPAGLFAAYRSGVPAASGGLWSRAAAVQALDAGLEGDGGAALGPLVLAADSLLTERGLRVALAAEYSGRLARVDAGKLDPAARASVAELLLLAGAPDAARQAFGTPDARFAALLAIAGAGPVPGASAGDLADAALSGLNAPAPDDDGATPMAGLLAEGRQGQAILAALDLVEAGPAVDPRALRTALAALGDAGQEESARRIALQTLLAGGA